ncbi:MAG: biotin/lipoyl-containing protein [Balneolaceae bacterium]
MKLQTTIQEQTFDIELDVDQGKAVVNDQPVPFEIVEKNGSRLVVRSGTRLFILDDCEWSGSNCQYTLDGVPHAATVKDDQQLLLEKLGFKTHIETSAGAVAAPMPGKILELLVAEGDEIEAGAPVAILEAMKMENELKAPCSGVVSTVSVSVGTNVEKNQPLIDIEPRG